MELDTFEVNEEAEEEWEDEEEENDDDDDEELRGGRDLRVEAVAVSAFAIYYCNEKRKRIIQHRNVDMYYNICFVFYIIEHSI